MTLSYSCTTSALPSMKFLVSIVEICAKTFRLKRKEIPLTSFETKMRNGDQTVCIRRNDGEEPSNTCIINENDNSNSNNSNK